MESLSTMQNFYFPKTPHSGGNAELGRQKSLQRHVRRWQYLSTVISCAFVSSYKIPTCDLRSPQVVTPPLQDVRADPLLVPPSAAASRGRLHQLPQQDLHPLPAHLVALPHLPARRVDEEDVLGRVRKKIPCARVRRLTKRCQKGHLSKGKLNQGIKTAHILHGKLQVTGRRRLGDGVT